jgi:hypothetical protein
MGTLFMMKTACATAYDQNDFGKFDWIRRALAMFKIC